MLPNTTFDFNNVLVNVNKKCYQWLL